MDHEQTDLEGLIALALPRPVPDAVAVKRKRQTRAARDALQIKHLIKEKSDKDAEKQELREYFSKIHAIVPNAGKVLGLRRQDLAASESSRM